MLSWTSILSDQKKLKMEIKESVNSDSVVDAMAKSWRLLVQFRGVLLPCVRGDGDGSSYYKYSVLGWFKK